MTTIFLLFLPETVCIELPDKRRHIMVIKISREEILGKYRNIRNDKAHLLVKFLDDIVFLGILNFELKVHLTYRLV